MIYQNTQTALLIIANDVQRGIKTGLRKKKKVVTKKTINSIKARVSGLKSTVVANKSLLYITKGRMKGAKRPVQKVNGRFELVPELALWKKTLGIKIPDYLLAKGISDRGIPPTPIVEPFLQSKDAEYRRQLNAAISKDMITGIVESVTEIYLK